MAKRILIVEDEPLIRENYVQALRKYGYEVQAVGDRSSAMNLFSSRLPDLVILLNLLNPLSFICLILSLVNP